MNRFVVNLIYVMKRDKTIGIAFYRHDKVFFFFHIYQCIEIIGRAFASWAKENEFSKKRSIFGHSVPLGKLPVNVPMIDIAQTGATSFSEIVLYDRGFGLENRG